MRKKCAVQCIQCISCQFSSVCLPHLIMIAGFICACGEVLELEKWPTGDFGLKLLGLGSMLNPLNWQKW